MDFAFEAAGVLTHTKGKKGKAAVPVHFRHIGFDFRQLSQHNRRALRALAGTPWPRVPANAVHSARPKEGG